MKTEGSSGRIMAGLLILCLVGMGIWLILARNSRQPWTSFQHTASEYEAFNPVAGKWSWRVVAVGNDDPTAPNLIALVGTSQNGAEPGVMVRLVHGYNMPMCMRIKGYQVELLREERGSGGGREQIWRLRSDLNEPSLWLTRMIRADDLSDTGRDIRDLAFPRVGTPDDPRWVPQGFHWKALRHPWINLRLLLRASWNASRTDWRTFLKLRQPAWVSDEELTVVAAGLSHPSLDEEKQEMVRIQSAEQEFLQALRAYHHSGRTNPTQ